MMGFKPVNNMAIDIKKQKDKAYIGHYLGNKEITTQIGPQIIWNFEAENGDIFGIYSFTMLTRAMENVKVGTLCRITYLGTENVQTKKFGKKDVHQVLVETDTDGMKEDDVPEGAEVEG